MKNFKIYQNVTLLVFILLIPLQAYSYDYYSLTKGAIIYNSTVSANRTLALGVNTYGHLNTTRDGSGGISENPPRILWNKATGIAYKWPSSSSVRSRWDGNLLAGKWQDATSPGCLCEGWGVSGNGYVGRANVSVGGVYQEPEVAYNLGGGGTTIVFSAAPGSGGRGRCAGKPGRPRCRTR